MNLKLHTAFSFRFCVVLLAFALPSFGWAQLVDPNAEIYAGTENCRIYSVFQDYEGVIWAGSDCGLYRVSGTVLTNVTDSLPIPSPEVFCITQTADSALWFGTNYGIVRRQESWQEFSESEAKFVTDIVPATDSTIFAATFYAVFEGKPSQAFVQVDGLSMLRKNGEFELCDDQSVWYRGLGRFTNISTSDYSSWNTDLEFDEKERMETTYFEGNAYFFRENSIYKLGRKVSKIAEASAPIHSLFGADYLYAYVEGEGICKMIDGRFELVHECVRLNGFVVDNEGGVWPSEGTKGLQRIHSQSLGLRQVEALNVEGASMYKDGHDWYFLYDGSLSGSEEEIVSNSWLTDPVNNIVLKGDNEWWFGGRTIGLFKDNEFYTLAAGVGSVKGLHIDNGHLMVASSHGLFVFDVETIIDYLIHQPEDDLAQIEWCEQFRWTRTRGFDLQALSDGRICFSSQAGIMLCDSLSCDTIIPYSEIGFTSSMTQINDSLFCGIHGRNSLSVFNLRQERQTYHFPGIQLRTITVEDDALYISSTEGVFVGKSPSQVSSSIDFQLWEGLKDVYDVLKVDDQFLFKSADYLYSLESASLRSEGRKEIHHNIQLLNASVNDGILGKRIKFGQGIPVQFVLEADRREQSFGAYFEYRFDDEDGDWQVAQNNTLSFEKLESGNYTLETRAVYPFANSISAPATTKFTVTGPWWRTPWWFIVILLVSFTVALAVIRVGNNRKRRELETTNRLISMHNMALRSQLNSHFIFNAMNSLQASIVGSSKDKSLSLVQLLARHLRRVFYISAKDAIKLMDEVELLDDYLQIEQARFGKRLNYSIHAIPDGLHNVEVPPMFIQPIVENCVKHGLPTRSEGFKISIMVLRSNDNLKVIVSDNGLGCDPSAFMTADMRQSGIQNVRDRLAGIKKGKGYLKHVFVNGDKGPFRTEIILEGVLT
ncbi:histidine kinase [Sanyastnella coralliicola]|uniref:histidine kinase n=1 Tax=Sanyastnella coralliicola TaxID=3069118 RepID=UPI0027B89F25|nr:histidine kinase [Longitalea sp. SCSIO 12813]